MIHGPHIGIVTGFAETPGLDDFLGALEKKIHPTSCTVLNSVPLEKASRHPELVVDDVSRELDHMQNLDPEEMALVGHSYGALIALVASCRRQLRGISKFFLIDGPLRSHVKVEQVKGLFSDFSVHYAYRETLAKEWESALKDIDISKIVAIGSGVDAIVPPEAKFLPDLPIIRLERDEDTLRMNASGGCNIVLPPGYRGHSINHRGGIVAEIMRRILTS